MAGLKFDDGMPRIMPSKTHAAIDYIHAGTNFIVSAFFGRRNRRASTGAFILGASVLANALMTDHELGLSKLYSFKVHGILDYGVAAASAAMPALLGITGTKEAKFFYEQGAGESVIAAISDYDDDSGARRQGHRLDDRFRMRRIA
jgi:hypothetical protein